MPKFDIKTAETRLRKDGPANLYYIYGLRICQCKKIPDNL